MVMSRLAKLSNGSPRCPEADANAALTPNQTIRIMANPRNRFSPRLSKRSACVVMRLVRNAKKSFKESLSMASAPLRHSVGLHTGARIAALTAQERLFFGHETNVAVDCGGFGIALTLRLNDLLFGQRH